VPELPEVETVARGLREQIAGRRILSVRLGKTDFIDDPEALERDLPGTRIESVVRYGKFLLLRLAPGNGAAQAEGKRTCLLVHLGMTGQLAPRHPAEPVARHTHAFFALDDGRELRYTDIRRFGRMALVSEAALDGVLGKLGLDPLEITQEEFRARLAGRRAMTKALLLDQRVLRGMGNIYCDESLWRARIHPARHAARLKPEELTRLYRAIRKVLSEAIRLRGSSVSNYVDAEGQPGRYQLRHRVYQRGGKGCFRCGTKIRRVIVAGRSSYFCLRCQPAPRKRGMRTVSHRARAPQKSGKQQASARHLRP
jgi:formamidopyrimidine-DNA glycosylase